MTGAINHLQWGAGTVAGPAHRKANGPNQDAYACFATDQVLAAAVADGLGSRPKSHHGARQAAELAALLAAEHLLTEAPSLIPEHWLAELKARILLSWRSSFGKQYPSYASTLLLVALSSDRAVVGQLGDGLVALHYQEGNCRILDHQDRPFQNITTSLAHPEAFAHFQMEELIGPARQGLDGILLMTDGVADDLEDPEAFCTDALNMLRQQPGLSWGEVIHSWLQVWPTPGRTDDQTLLVVSLGEPPAQEANVPAPESPPAAAAPQAQLETPQADEGNAWKVIRTGALLRRAAGGLLPAWMRNLRRFRNGEARHGKER
jgi:serine/threonine protein phosphatase PrpC